MLIMYKTAVFDEVYILFRFNIILTHNRMPSTKTVPYNSVRKEKQIKKIYIYLTDILIQKAKITSRFAHLYTLMTQ